MNSDTEGMTDDWDNPFDEYVIVITGASRGIGRHMAEAFVARGATVVCSSRTKESLEANVRNLSEGPGHGTAIAVPADVREWDDVKTLVDHTIDEFKGIDVFINNAGVSYLSITGGEQPPIVDHSIDVWNTIIETNLTGAFLCTKATLPGMLERGSGRFIHISSGMGIRGRANRAAYVASKFGLEGLHQSLAEELDGTGVSSVVLDPGGGVYTSGFWGHLGEEAKQLKNDPAIIVEPSLRLAAGEGNNGDRFVATEMIEDRT